jgi:phage terminase large subunit
MERGLDEAVQAALWFKRIKEISNEKFLPLFFDQHRHLVLMGGGGSGKSIFAGQKIIDRCISEKKHRFLVVRKVARTLRESCFDQLKTQAQALCPEEIARIPKGKGSDMYLQFKNGSEIIFAGLDDVEKLKSIHDITGIWIEEASEIEERDFDQLDIRLRGNTRYYKQIILTFNPISITHWLKKRFFDRQDERVRTHRSVYWDNRFLPEEDRLTLEAMKETDPYYYQVYCLGQWGVLSQTIFDRETLMRKLQSLPEPETRGEFDYGYNEIAVKDWTFREDAAGETVIYRQPEKGHPYVIGADTAGEGSDWFVADVIDNATGRLVAKYRTRTDEDLFARQLYCLGMYYNTALIGVEVNFSTHPVKELQRLRYPKLYLREVEDSVTKKVRMSYGFRTDRLTRPTIIAGLVGIMREHPELVDDEDTIQEMLTFARNSKGRPEAIEGAHDDCVMALAITYYIRDQQETRIEKPRGDRVKWHADQWEDYDNASEAEKAELLKLWGNPF